MTNASNPNRSNHHRLVKPSLSPESSWAFPARTHLLKQLGLLAKPRPRTCNQPPSDKFKFSSSHSTIYWQKPERPRSHQSMMTIFSFSCIWATQGSPQTNKQTNTGPSFTFVTTSLNASSSLALTRVMIIMFVSEKLNWNKNFWKELRWCLRSVGDWSLSFKKLCSVARLLPFLQAGSFWVTNRSSKVA